MSARVAVLGPGGVGGLVAAVLARADFDTVVIAREPTAELIAREGIRVDSVRFGTFTARPRAQERLEEDADVLVVTTKAVGLEEALGRVAGEPALVVPLLNGLDHVSVLRERFGARAVAGVIRVESDRPEPGVVVHTSPSLRVDVASDDPAPRVRLDAFVDLLRRAEIPAQVGTSEAMVLWSKLVRLNALALTTSAHESELGAIRDRADWRAELVGAIDEAAAVARAEGADIDAAKVVAELWDAHGTLGSSMQRDLAAGRPPELDAIPGAVLRAAARHGLPCPVIEGLVAAVRARL